jgi:hypothetical protein
MDKKVKVIQIAVDNEPRVLEIEPTLKNMQELVGGLIDIARVNEDGLMVCFNDEGKLLGLPLNVLIWGGRDCIAGDCFLFRDDEEGEVMSVNQKDIEEYVGRGYIADL